MEKTWFTAECIYYRHGPENLSPDAIAAEVRYFLIGAASEEEAHEKALPIAKQREHSYINADGDPLEWRLKGVARVVELFDRELKEGSEVFYKYLPDTSSAAWARLSATHLR